MMVAKNGWFIMENPMKFRMVLGVAMGSHLRKPPYFHCFFEYESESSQSKTLKECYGSWYDSGIQNCF